MADEQPDSGRSDSGKKGSGGALGDLVKAESMIQLALILPGACFIGWVIGTALDTHFHRNWISIAGVLLGAVAGFIQIFLTASRFLKRDGS